MDIGLYVHVPFCPSKCGYCDFYSHVPSPDIFEPFVDAMILELDQALAPTEICVETIFVGGGTPTLLPSPHLERLFDRLRRIVDRDRPVEFTVEANPASLTIANAAVLRRGGVDRISMGAQSFHAHELHTLGRVHGPADVAASAAVVHQAGFKHFNLDLILGIPGQTETSLTQSLEQAINLKPDHLACYGLTYEPDTPLRRRLDQGLITRTEDELEAWLYDLACDILEANGFRQYEISNFAQPGAESRHNLRYWLNLPYIGVGPSAASYMSGRRWKNVPDTAEYLRRIESGQSLVMESEELLPLERAGEMAMLRLRLSEGIDVGEFQAATGYNPHELFAQAITRHVQQNLLIVDNERIVLTRKGRLVGDTVIADFLSPHSASTDGT